MTCQNITTILISLWTFDK